MSRDDLGALFAGVTRRLIDAERPLLDAHGLSMWGYVALTELAQGPAPTQLALARAMHYDKTRLIRVLDDLQRDGLVAREPDPADRRNLVVRLTPEGERRRRAAQKDIHAMEDALLADLKAGERDQLRALLGRLAP